MKRIRQLVAAGLVLTFGLLAWPPASALLMHPGTLGPTHGRSDSPILDLRFTESLHGDINYTGASDKTCFNASGVLTTFASGVPALPCYTFDGTNWNPVGIAEWEARTNLMLHSEDADNAVHGKTRVTVTQDSVAAPDGNTTMDTVLETAVTNTFHLNYDTITVSGSTAHTWIIFVRKFATRRYVEILNLGNGAGGDTHSAVFDLDAGAFTATLTDDSGTQALFVEDVGGGIFRIGQSFTTASDDTTNIPQIWVADADEHLSNHVGSTSEGVYAWGAQFEVGAFPTSYIATTTATVTRAADIPSMADVSWFNADTNSFLVEFFLPDSHAGNRNILRLGNNTFNELYNHLQSSSLGNRLRFGIIAGGVTQFTLHNTPAPVPAGAHKSAGAMTLSEAVVYLDGTQLATDTGTYTAPAITQFDIGVDHTGAEPINGYISRIAFWNRDLSDGRLQDKTAFLDWWRGLMYAANDNEPFNMIEVAA